MPSDNRPLHRRVVWSLIVALVTTCVAPVAPGATASIPRACESELNFKSIAQMADQASDFERRLALLAKSLVQDRRVKRVAGDDEGSAASEMEEVNVGTLRSSLAEVSGYLLAAEDLAAVRDLMVEDRDHSTVNRQLKLVAQQIQDPLWLGLESAKSVSAMTKRPAVAAEVSEIQAFMDQTRGHFAACGGSTDH